MWAWKADTRKVRLELRQLQSEPAFPNSLPFDIVTANGKRRVVLKPTSKRTIEEVSLDETPLSIDIDPENTVLMEARQTRER
jgi:arginase family enzyme